MAVSRGLIDTWLSEGSPNRYHERSSRSRQTHDGQSHRPQCSLVVLKDGWVFNVPAKEARVTNVWFPSTHLEIWKDDPASLLSIISMS